jgi:hypothetical protein
VSKETPFKRMSKDAISWVWHVIPATRKAEIRRITVQGQPGKKLTRPHLNSNKKSQVSWHIPMIPCYAGSRRKKIVVQNSLGKSVRPYFKNNQSKQGWGCGSVTASIASMKPWVQIPVPPKNKQVCH